MNETFEITTTALHLDDGLGMCPHRRDGSSWRDDSRREAATGRLLSVWTYAATWDYREQHPDGDELVLALEGTAQLLLGDADTERAVPLSRGDAFVIPKGAWHRVATNAACTLLFVTPVPARTRHEPVA